MTKWMRSACMVVSAVWWCDGFALPEIPVAQCDTDGNGALSWDEVQSCEKNLYATIVKSGPASSSQCDVDANGQLTEEELTLCFVVLDPTARAAAEAEDPIVIAQDQASSLLDAGTVTVPMMKGRLEQQAMQVAKEEPLVIGSPRMTIGRTLTDAADPRAAETSVPLIVSFTDDRDGDDDSLVALGSISYLAKEFGGELSGTDAEDRLTQLLFLKLDADVTTKNDPADSSLTFSTPLQFSLISSKSELDSWDLQFALEPKYVTDRDFRRDVYEIAVPITVASSGLARAGLITPFGGDRYNRLSRYTFSWQPSVAITAGRIADAGGNADLEALKLKGDYLRLAPAVSMKLRFPFAQQRFSLAGSYTHRFDVEQDWDHGFTTAGLQYDLTRTFALTITYRHGRKPPDFSATDDVLIGFGVSQFSK